MEEKMKQIVSMFAYEGEPYSCKAYGNGHINSTYQIMCKNGGKTARYILQRINSNVFPDTAALMENIENVTSFLKSKIAARGGDVLRETLNLVPTVTGKNYYTDESGGDWRSYIFIEEAVCCEKIEKPEDFYHCGYAFGNFQNLLSDFPAEKLHEVIPDFHHTPARYETFQKAVQTDRCGRAKSVGEEIAFVTSHAEEMPALMDMRKKGEIPLRVTHNDTKLNNCMLDKHTGKPICVIDLDTVMPGLRAFDYGDSIRFGATTGAEDEPDLSKVHFSLSLFESYTKGFLESCGESMTEKETMSLPVGAKLMTLECGMRFLTDYLEGDTYFKISRADHNRDRCRTQFRLVSDMEKQWDEMNRIVMCEWERSKKNAVDHG